MADYVTNTPAERMSLEQSLKYYRDESTVNRDFIGLSKDVYRYCLYLFCYRNG